MWRSIFIIGTSLLILCGNIFADGGIVQLQQVSGVYRITLFSEPSPLRAGPVDLSVLVQKNGDPVLDADVSLHLELAKKSDVSGSDWRAPCCEMDGGSDQMTLQATHNAATNKLLYAAPALLPSAGDWTAKITIKEGDNTMAVSGNMFVQPPAASWVAYLPWLLLPVLGVGFFALVQMAKAKKSDP
ncbi:MAG: hypothetical protein ABI443_07135 [Chthoniobacterales bacterium]